MDINLPGISGLDALKILRSDPLTRHIPVLALSADAMERDIRNGPVSYTHLDVYKRQCMAGARRRRCR